MTGDADHVGPPPGRELEWKNRRLLAERRSWPPGAVEACEAIEAAHPAWKPDWYPENTNPGFERVAGFYARRRAARYPKPTTYGADPAALIADIETVVSCCPTCGLRIPAPAGSSLPMHDDAGTGEHCKVHWGRGSVAVWSRCPVCSSVLDVWAGLEVPPHQVDGEWCRARCSQRTV